MRAGGGTRRVCKGRTGEVGAWIQWRCFHEGRWRMIRIKVDSEWTLEDLGASIQPVEVYDRKNKLLGLFIPASMGRRIQRCGRKLSGAELTEIERRKQSPERG